MSIFVHLWEAYLGIEPHFDLYQHLFHLKLQPNATNIVIVGGAGLQLHQVVEAKYIPYKLTSKVIDWKDFWFYMENQVPAPPSPKKFYSTSSKAKLEFDGRKSGSD